MRGLSALRVSGIFLVLLHFLKLPVHAQMDPDLCARYFKEAEAISKEDNGHLWNIPLYGPMLFADPQTRKVIANTADGQNQLKPVRDVFEGTLPDSVVIANTAIDWAGVHWTMVVWPLPDDQTMRGSLMMHELFHRVQGKLGFPLSNSSCDHLDTAEGRLWMQMEWNALHAALILDTANQNQAISDAILFRKFRRSLFPDAAKKEHDLEMNEGLAEYTGTALSGGIPAALRLLEEGPSRNSFVRSFAYVTGPAYGLLLDSILPGWRSSLKSSDELGVLLQNTLRLNREASSAVKRASLYGYDEIQKMEQQREDKRRSMLAMNRKKFLTDPHFAIPLKQMQVQFDPNQLQPFEGYGTVYPTLRISDVWGVLIAEDGALITQNWTEVIVTAPTSIDEKSLSGSGWSLQLNPGWQVVKDSDGINFHLNPQ